LPVTGIILLSEKEFTMGILNEKIKYDDLEPKKQKEIYNFQKVSAIFADYGYSVTLLRDDDKFADFVAVPFSGDKKKEPLFVQLKGGLTFWKEYSGKNLYICFPDHKHGTWYLYPHDILCEKLKSRLQENSAKWRNEESYGVGPSETALSFPNWAKDYLDEYKIDP